MQWLTAQDATEVVYCIAHQGGQIRRYRGRKRLLRDLEEYLASRSSVLTLPGRY